MWRHATRLTTRPTRWWTTSIGSSTRSSVLPMMTTTLLLNQNQTNTTIRYFARRSRNLLDDPEDEPKQQRSSERERLSATQMELFALGEDMGDDDNDEDEGVRMDAAYQRKQEAIRKELDSRTGRGWTDPWQISEEQWMSVQTADDLPQWTPEFVSRISQERVKIYPDGIPTLSALATMSLPPEPCPHPGLGKTKEYAAFRKKFHYNQIAKKVEDLAKPKLDAILKLTQWQEKQDAVDELFESVEEQLRTQEEILGLHPDFGKWVEKALEKYLTKVKYGDVKVDADKTETESRDADAEPIFMDCYNKDDGESMVPSILLPLAPHPRDGPGRMVEEWELAAHKTTKRILMRQSTRKVAETLMQQESSRIFVCGRKGVGKTAVLASIVASARKSGHVVMYLPDGDRLRKNGYFVTPNTHREGIYDLQDLSQEACAHFLTSHGADLEGMQADKATMDKFFKQTQLSKMGGYSGESMGIVELLKHAAQHKPDAPMCFSVVVDVLMNQTEKPFVMVLDEFNCYFDRGHYFHMSYDKDVIEPIPYGKINLFEHALAAMAISSNPEDENVDAPRLMKRGAIIVAVTDSHAVPRKVTSGLEAYAKAHSASDESLTVVEVPQFSDLEADHILANFEAIGVGSLRFDRGDTLMDANEVAYLKMVSGSIGQKLVDASVI